MATLNCLLNAGGRIGKFNPDGAYMFFIPATILEAEGLCGGYCGYHNSVTDPATQTSIRYASAKWTAQLSDWQNGILHGACYTYVSGVASKIESALGASLSQHLGTCLPP